MTAKELDTLLKKLKKDMKEAAANLQFERAAELRDLIFEYKSKSRS
jgi:excinuclease ABC subunit B